MQVWENERTLDGEMPNLDMGRWQVKFASTEQAESCMADMSTIGLQWAAHGSRRPFRGTQIINETLTALLVQKQHLTFSELEGCKLGNLAPDSFVNVNGQYFMTVMWYVIPWYNSTPLDIRGWPIFENAVSMEAITRAVFYPKMRDLLTDTSRLPAKLMRIGESQPEVGRMLGDRGSRVHESG